MPLLNVFGILAGYLLFISCILQTKFTALDEGLKKEFFFISLAGSLSVASSKRVFAVQVPYAYALTQESVLPRESFDECGP